MPSVEIEAGESKEIIAPDSVESGVPYYFRVQGAPVKVAKREEFLGRSGFTLPDTTGIPITPEENGFGKKDGFYFKNVGEEPVTVEWQKTGFIFGNISLGQQASSDTEVARLFERQEGLDIENGDSVTIDLTQNGRSSLEIAFNIDSAVNVDVKASNTGEFSGEEWTVDTIQSGNITAGQDYSKGYDVSAFRFVRLDFSASGGTGDSGTAEISGVR